VGTSELVHAAIAKNAKVEFDVVSNPEFLREGFAVEDFMKPDRVVIGTSSSRAAKIMEDLYKPFVRQGNPMIIMDEKSAELTKYAANAFLATKITFMNEIANFCELVGADVDKIRAGIGTDSRIGKRFLFPGIGYGGSCFPKDVQALVKSGKDSGFHFEILDSVLKVNNSQKLVLIRKMKNYFGGSLRGKRFALWGLAFKPDTDDIREAPALYMIDALLEEGAAVSVFDPEAMDNVSALYGEKISRSENMYEVLENADALLIATEWAVFRNPDFNKIGQMLNAKVIFDGRNLFETEKLRELGFYYESIGREIVNPN
jgi:UDPglucose 6-dehydrogenase